MTTLCPSRTGNLALVATLLLAGATFSRAAESANDSGAGPDRAFDASRWDRLVEDTHTAPIVIPAGSISEAELNLRRDHWLVRRLLVPATASLAGDPAAAELGGVLEGIVHRLSKVDIAVPDVPVREQIRRFAKRTTRQPCVDYLLGCGLDGLNYWDDARVQFHRAMDAPEDSHPLPLVFQLLAQGAIYQEACNLGRGNREEAEKSYYDLLTRTLAAPMDDDDVHFITRLMIEGTISAICREREDRHAKIFEAAPLPEWSRLLCLANVEVNRGWRENNEGFTAPDAAATRRRDEAYSRAEADLRRSWQLHPSLPYAAARMVQLRWVIPAHGIDLRLWFDRAIAAVSDYMPVYRDYLTQTRTASEAVAFGRVCAETKRYDLQIPSFFGETLLRVGAHMDDWHQLYDEPALAAMLIETRRQCAEHAAPGQHNLQCNELALEAWLTRRYDAAAAALNEIRGVDGVPIGSWSTFEEAQELDIALPFVYRDAVLRGGPTGEEYVRAVDLLSAGKRAEAEERFKSLLAAADSFTTELIKSDLLLVDFQKKYATGDWAPLPLQEKLCWTQHEGQGMWAEDVKRFRIQSASHFSRTTFRGNLGPRYEVRGHFFVSHDHYAKAVGLGIFGGHSPIGFGRGNAWWWNLRIDTEDAEHFCVHYGPKFDGQPEDKRKHAGRKEDNAFTYRYDNGRLSFSMSDTRVIDNVFTESDRPMGENAFGFGIFAPVPGCTVELWDWEARRLDLAL